MTWVAVIAGTILVLDQITKVLALDRLVPGVPLTLVEGYVALTLVMNTGLAFGLLAWLPPSWRWIVVLLSVVALVVVARLAVRLLGRGGWPDTLAIGLLFGGAIGNLVDRARFGAVVDFVDLHARGWHWPAFNVADSAITVGVAILALRLFGPAHAPPA